MHQTIVPMPWQGTADQCTGEMSWLQDLGSNVYCALWQGWPQHDLPTGYQGYIVSFHLEAVDIAWLERQCQRLQAPVAVLSDGKYYDWPKPDNLECFRYIYWHRQLESMMQWFPDSMEKTIKYKASAFSNRITQSKMVVFTALMTHLGGENCYLTLGDWVDERNIHYRQSTGNQTIDNLSETFYNQYLGKGIEVDEFDHWKNNIPTFTANPWTPAYQQSALNFTNESFHYSYQGSYVRPGPFITEKTLKCLLGGTGLVPVGQMGTYTTLEELGFKFDYGFDTAWDQLPGDLDRLTAIVGLIKDLSKYTAKDLYAMTQSSSIYNQQYIQSGEFSVACKKVNLTTADRVFNYFKH